MTESDLSLGIWNFNVYSERIKMLSIISGPQNSAPCKTVLEILSKTAEILADHKISRIVSYVCETSPYLNITKSVNYWASNSTTFQPLNHTCSQLHKT